MDIIVFFESYWWSRGKYFDGDVVFYWKQVEVIILKVSLHHTVLLKLSSYCIYKFTIPTYLCINLIQTSKKTIPHNVVDNVTIEMKVNSCTLQYNFVYYSFSNFDNNIFNLFGMICMYWCIRSYVPADCI